MHTLCKLETLTALARVHCIICNVTWQSNSFIAAVSAILPLAKQRAFGESSMEAIMG